MRTSAAIIWAVRVAARGAPPVPLRGPLRPLAIIKLIFKLGAFVALPLKEAHALVAGKRPRKPKSCPNIDKHFTVSDSDPDSLRELLMGPGPSVK